MVLRLLVAVMPNKRKRYAYFIVSSDLVKHLFLKEKEEDGTETKQKSATRKKKKEIDLPITPRVPGATKTELDRLIEQEVKSRFTLFHKSNRDFFFSLT